ncbi:unnamed protein product, partial [Ectocarpus sp. 4 AP-2014]
PTSSAACPSAPRPRSSSAGGPSASSLRSSSTGNTSAPRPRSSSPGSPSATLTTRTSSAASGASPFPSTGDRGTATRRRPSTVVGIARATSIRVSPGQTYATPSSSLRAVLSLQRKMSSYTRTLISDQRGGLSRCSAVRKCLSLWASSRFASREGRHSTAVATWALDSDFHMSRIPSVRTTAAGSGSTAGRPSSGATVLVASYAAAPASGGGEFKSPASEESTIPAACNVLVGLAAAAAPPTAAAASAAAASAAAASTSSSLSVVKLWLISSLGVWPPVSVAAVDVVASS